jgi:RNA polymerase sigma-70 factor (ECF subfamily)
MDNANVWDAQKGMRVNTREAPRAGAGSFEKVALVEMPVLYRVAKRLTLDLNEAEDLVGQTLVKAVGAWSSFDGRFARSWLIRILKNEHLGNLRKSASRPTTVPLDDTQLSEEDCWEEVSWKAVGEEIWKELDALPEAFRLTIALCDVEELTYEEAAEAMDVPVGTVRSRLFRARRMLRSKLARLSPEGGTCNVGGVE